MEASNGEENDSSGVNTEVAQTARLHSSAVPIQSSVNGKHKHSNESVSSISSYRYFLLLLMYSLIFNIHPSIMLYILKTHLNDGCSFIYLV